MWIWKIENTCYCQSFFFQYEWSILNYVLTRCLARVTQKLKGMVTNQRAFDVALLDSFAAASLQELDYLNEAANQVRLK